MGKRIATHDMLFLLTATQHFAQLMTIVPLERTFRCLQIQTLCLKNETNFIQRSSRSEIIHFLQIQIDFFHIRFSSCLFSMIKQNLTIPFCIYEVRMSSTDDSRSRILPGCTSHFNIQFLFNVFFQLNLYALTGNHLLAFFHAFRSNVLQNFQTIF